MKNLKEYRKTATVRAKLFEKGDEDGFVSPEGVTMQDEMENHLFGIKNTFIPYISILENQKQRGEFGKHYICVGIDGEKCLVEKELFEEIYTPVTSYSEKNKGANEPAFPESRIVSSKLDGRETTFFSEYTPGLSKQAIAAIELRVPNSGEEWLDEMIRISNLRDASLRAMEGLLSNGEDASVGFIAKFLGINDEEYSFEKHYSVFIAKLSKLHATAVLKSLSDENNNH